MRIGFATLAVLALSSLASGQHIGPLPDLPQAVSSPGTAAADGYLYAYGGLAGKDDSRGVLGTFHRLKLTGGAGWEELPGGPALHGVSLTVHGGKPYRVGGLPPCGKTGRTADAASVSECARFDPGTSRWQPLPPLPAGRSSHDAVVVGDRLIAVGGWQVRGGGIAEVWHDTTLVLDLAADTLAWRAVRQPFRRRALAAAVVGTKVYALGGTAPDGDRHGRVDVFDAATETWSTGPDVPGSRAGFCLAAGTVEKRLVVSTSEGLLYRLSESGEVWEKVGESRSTRVDYRLIPHGPDAVLVGGASRTGRVAALEIVKLGETSVRSGPRR